MKRRHLLRTAGAVATAGLAGCVGGLPGAPDETPTDGPADRPYSFTVTSTRCGNQTNRADVAFGEGTVTVEGTLWGNDACYTGRLESLSLEDGTLTLRVDAVSTADADQACAECITEIDYRASVEVEDRPDEVVVVHRGETVATVRP